MRNPSASTLTGHILLVDDNLNGLAARKAVLEELGHRVVTASSAAEALEQFARHNFDLVVTDYRMPRMDGLELIARLRQHRPDLPIVLISGVADALGLSEATTGADAVIQKSANEVMHLTRAVARLLRRKPARKAALRETPQTQPKASSAGT